MNNHLNALKQYISSRGDTQETLAKAIGMNRTTLAFKLNGYQGKDFTISDMRTICAHYDIPLEQRTALFFGAR